MSYRRVTVFERRCIHRWRQAGFNQSEISRRLDRPRSTVSREIARNSGGSGYQHRQAERMAQERARRPGPRKFTEELKAEAESRLREGWTPDMISGRGRLEERPWVCKETIYKHIYADAKAGGDLWKNLPRAHRKRRRRCPRDDSRRQGKIANRRMIDTRPPEVETRATVGHWEGDLINGASKTGNLVTLVERNTRFTLVDRTESKEALEVARTMCKLFARMPQASRLSLTLDNGKEFTRHEQMAKKAGMDVFFAHPYHSWERGTNENTNGLIRRKYPKKSSFRGIGKTALKRIDTFLNDRPRKCLGWMTPREKMAAFLATAP
ncbi:MAG: IS30 family transposase [Verrucomicrobia bacterium]|nr:IS30 family transposase [Verrucomicrobiota bacterium]